MALCVQQDKGCTDVFRYFISMYRDMWGDTPCFRTDSVLTHRLSNTVVSLNCPVAFHLRFGSHAGQSSHPSRSKPAQRLLQIGVWGPRDRGKNRNNSKTLKMGLRTAKSGEKAAPRRPQNPQIREKTVAKGRENILQQDKVYVYLFQLEKQPALRLCE